MITSKICESQDDAWSDPRVFEKNPSSTGLTDRWATLQFPQYKKTVYLLQTNSWAPFWAYQN